MNILNDREKISPAAKNTVKSGVTKKSLFVVRFKFLENKSHCLFFFLVSASPDFLCPDQKPLCSAASGSTSGTKKLPRMTGVVCIIKLKLILRQRIVGSSKFLERKKGRNLELKAQRKEET